MNNENVQSENKDKIKLPTKLIAVVAALLVIITIVVVIEAVNTRRISIENNTKKNIESIHVYIENYGEDDFNGEDIITTEIKAGDSYSGKFDSMEPSRWMYASVSTVVKFEGEDEKYQFAGNFTREFNGKISIDFVEKNGDIVMNVKATDGIFKSTKFTNLDDSFKLNEMLEPAK